MRSKFRRSAIKALKATIYLVVIPLITIQLGLRLLLISQRETAEVLQNDGIALQATENLTVWDALRNDSRVSRFADIVGMFDDIVQGLSATKASFTVYAPVNEAFEKEHFPYDLPWFYWKFLAGYHMGPGAVSGQELRYTRTVSSFVNADIFFTYKQRISTQFTGGRVTFNHKVGLLSPGTRAANGYVHLVDGLIKLPDATADVLRERPSLSKLRHALIITGLSDIINDTNTHVGQTLFAPSNTAFEKLGTKLNTFLFSRRGRPYLKALLKCHVAANRTLFVDMYFPHGGHPSLVLQEGSSVELPTLHDTFNLTANVGRTNAGLSLTLGDRTEVSAPDMVVMDGVVHEIDSLLIPPAGGANRGRDASGSWMTSRFTSWPWRKQLGLEEFMERLEWLLED